jgi:hypothetical protein
MATVTDLSFVVRMFREPSDKNEASLRMNRQCNDPEWGRASGSRRRRLPKTRQPD